MDDSEPTAGKTAGEVVGLLGEVVDERVQSEGAGRSRQEGLHECCCLFGEVVPVDDSEAGGVDDGAQLVGGGQVAELGPVGPWERVVELPGVPAVMSQMASRPPVTSTRRAC